MNDLMIIVESAMISIMFGICIYSSITDLKRGIVRNSTILLGSVLSVVLNLVYYAIFAKDYFAAYIINFFVMVILSLTFYATHIWAAGDSKLLIFVISMIPARIYFSGNNVAATVTILIVIFSFAFIYYVFESVYLSIKEKSFFSSYRNLKIDILKMLIQYLKCTCVVTIVNFIFSLIMPDFYSANVELFMVVNMLIVFTICNISILDKWYILAPLAIGTVLIATLQNRRLEFVNLRIYFVVAVVLLLRIIAEKHNYKTIDTADAKPGMVLSYSTIIQFMPSRIKGLPTSTTEDIRSRISEEEAKNIIRWKDSKYGQEAITIVRKIPFAIFITIGAVFFVIARMIIWKFVF